LFLHLSILQMQQNSDIIRIVSRHTKATINDVLEDESAPASTTRSE
jgi:hypothetical protein